ncbi:uncharacterized protein LOC143038706 [Oratosquilla oratoria]|uniref:uncharacterized protein LOC143038706 n=1 Tax=Oratosquilla oratoria TaxID=337810 RepID=UPI003F7638EF
MSKINDILSDSSKFQVITRNPVEDIKKRANKFISSVNAKVGGIKLSPLTGDYGLGYCYGNIKTHKPGNPLRPIISQIPTPTYHLAKRLNDLLSPFTPRDYSLSSPSDFLDLLKGSSGEGVIASLDVESLYTNIDIDRTIQFILEDIYPEGSPPKIDIPKVSLQTLLELHERGPFRFTRRQNVQKIIGRSIKHSYIVSHNSSGS